MSASLVRLLEENSCRKFYIHYNTYFPNHLAQGSIALHRLGASSERITQFIEWYQPNLESGADHGAGIGETQPTSQGDMISLLGQHQNFYDILNFYETKLRNDYHGSVFKMVQQHFPTLMPGMAGAAFHGLIQTGYGLSVEHAPTVCEGLAWMHHSYMPLKFAGNSELQYSNQAAHTPMEVLAKIREDKAIQLISAEGVTSVKGKVACPFGQRIKSLLDDGASLMHYVSMLCGNSEPIASGSGDVIGSELVGLASKVYLASEHANQFFLLHGITAGWALKQVLRVLEDPEVVAATQKCYLACLLATYIVEGVPRMLDSNIGSELPPGVDWKGIMERTLASDWDEHVFKLVQVCKEMSSEEDKDMRHVYMKAALCALDHPLYVHFQ